MRKTMFVLAATLSIMGCKKGADEINAVNPSSKTVNTVKTTVPYDPANPILKNANTDILIGAAINDFYFTTSTYKTAYINRAKNQYNSITAENEMKFHFIQPTKEQWNFPDKTVKFIKDSLPANTRMHGHALIWYKNVPAWVWDAGGTATGEVRKDIYRKLMYRHIDTVLKHYYKIKATNGTPLVKSWDVVNEVFQYNSGSYRPIVRSDAESSVWGKELGNYDHVRLAFLYAREIALKIGDTNLKLFYNDYNHEHYQSKCDSIYSMVNKLKLLTATVNGVTKPIIDGVGMQMHTNHTVTISGGTGTSLAYSILKMKTTGLLVHISELDIQIKDASGTPTQIQRDDQARRWRMTPIIYRTTVPVNQRWGITLWNIGDTDNWRTAENTNAEATLYFKVNYYRKPTYEAFYKGLYEVEAY